MIRTFRRACDRFLSLRRGAERSGAAPAVLTPAQEAALARRVLPDETERAWWRASEQRGAAFDLHDYLFLTAGEAHPARVLDQLRWGGLVTLASRMPRELAAARQAFAGRCEFAVEAEPRDLTVPDGGPPLLFFSARKVLLGEAASLTERHSYDVRLAWNEARGEHDVLKRVPTLEQTMTRLGTRYAEAGQATLERAARKLVDKVFPVFLTREAAMLKILQRHLPEEHRNRVPRLLEMQQDDRGLVRSMRLEWLRLDAPGGGIEPMSQLEFARQGAQLLHHLHEAARVVHLDLRLDNLVVTRHGVGFVDFGSSVREGEDITSNPMLSVLFDEMLSASQVQRDLRRMIGRGRVTSPLFARAYGKIDRAIDLFYLVLQMNSPLSNGDFRGLVKHDADGEEAAALDQLTRRVLQPDDPDHPTFRSAQDVLAGIEEVAQAVAA